MTWHHLHLPFTLQSCHIGEEDEGGEQEGEEPSFEVRQTEMVWGDQGRGHRGSQRRSSSPRSDHTRTSHSAHPPPHTPCYNISFFFLISSCLFSLPHLHQLFTSCYGGLTCACLCWTQQSDQYSGLFLFFFAKLHDLSAERWCD